jgi:hypothetical protein
VDARAQEVVRRLAEIERGEVIAVRPDEGYLEICRDGRVARLQLPESELLALLADADGLDSVWGKDVPSVDGAARYAATHLDESLATREPHPSGWWTYRSGFFHPEPPWEAHRRRRDADGARPA